MSNLAIVPHSDDEALFLAFTLCRESADIQVVVIFDGYVQAQRGEPVTWQERREETRAALKELGVVKPPIFAGFSDATPDWKSVQQWILDLAVSLTPHTVYRPLAEIGGHEQHNLVSQCAGVINSPRTIDYTTYTKHGKSTGARPVPCTGDMIRRKLRALACYRSQIEVANCREHFMRGLHEYYA